MNKQDKLKIATKLKEEAIVRGSKKTLLQRLKNLLKKIT